MPSQSYSFSIGATVLGKYKIVKCLGEGSFGKVYLVTDVGGVKYALKILKLDNVPPHVQKRLLKRFDMEYETGRIDSPFLVHSLDHGSLNGIPYILMEFCPYGDLNSVTFDYDLNQVAHHVLYGLRALHRNGKVHRDLKPENVLIKEDGTAVLTDFGISGDRNHRVTLTDRNGMPVEKLGTYAFMPYEQLYPKDREITVLPTTDIFSFGVMMYLLITGELPYGPLSNQNDLVRYVNNLKEGRWNVGALRNSEFAQAVSGCLVTDYRQRLQSVDAVLRLMPPYSDPREKEEPFVGPTIQAAGYLLRVMQGDDYGMTYNITEMLRSMNFITVGRHDGVTANDIAIRESNSTYISRKHCTIRKLDGGYYKLCDGQRDIHSSSGWRRSTNGTFVNSGEVTESGCILSSGDIISIGDVKLRFEPFDLNQRDKMFGLSTRFSTI